jgi:hypothetical protein
VFGDAKTLGIRTNNLVAVGKKKEIKEIEIIGNEKTFDIISRHAFRISIISLSTDDALELQDEIDEWIAEVTKSEAKRDITV